MNKTKLRIYVWKAVLAPVVIATALWAKDGHFPTLVVLLAVLIEGVWQGVNAWGAFLSDPNGSKNGHTANGATAKPVVESPVVEPPKI